MLSSQALSQRSISRIWLELGVPVEVERAKCVVFDDSQADVISYPPAFVAIISQTNHPAPNCDNS